MPPELEHELFSRVASFFGEEEGFAQLRGAFVVVVGLGGVGSHAAHMLVSPLYGPDGQEEHRVPIALTHSTLHVVCSVCCPLSRRGSRDDSVAWQARSGVGRIRVVDFDQVRHTGPTYMHICTTLRHTSKC